MLYKMRKKEVFFVNEAQFFAPWRVVAEFADDSRLTFDGFTEEQARAAMEAASPSSRRAWIEIRAAPLPQKQPYATAPPG